MSTKRIPFWGKILKAYFAFKDLALGYHTNRQNQSHLGVLRHDPDEKEQVGFFLFPGTKVDTYNQVPLVERNLFTLMRVEQLWEGSNGQVWVGVNPKWLINIGKAIRRLKKYERFVKMLEGSSFLLASVAKGPVHGPSVWGITIEADENQNHRPIARFFQPTVEYSTVHPFRTELLIKEGVQEKEVLSAIRRLKKHLRIDES